jgi:catechol 2,3-dioxygenase-like lactoylglutathione lyase family enzyme
MRFDHAVILVPDLERAVAAFEAHGFTVTAGGVHAGGATHNALIAFQDGSYVELLAFTRKLLAKSFPVLRSIGLGGFFASGRDQMEERFRSRALRRSGLIDFALLPTSMEADLVRARREGLKIEGPISGGRARADAEPISWLLALPEPPELPFFCYDVTDREERVPGGEATEHPNGVIGITCVTVAVERLETSSARYRALLGVEPESSTPEGMGVARGRSFRIGGVEVMLATTEDSSHAVWKHLRDRGEGPFELTMSVKPASRSGLTEICGTRLNLVRERPRSRA